MSGEQILKYAGIGAIVILAGQKAATVAANKVLVAGVDVKLNNTTAEGFHLSIFVDINNKLPVTVSIDNIIANIKYGSAILSTLVLPAPAVIDGSSITTIQFDTLIKFTDLAGNLLALFQSGQLINGLTIEGKIFTPDLTVRINQAIHPI